MFARCSSPTCISARAPARPLSSSISFAITTPTPSISRAFRSRNHRGSCDLMRILMATDAWYPQVNGVVQTLVSVGKALERMGVEVSFLTPEGIPSIPLPSYPDIRRRLPSPRAIARRIDDFQPDVIHIATEGPIGHFVRRQCLKRRRGFTTSFHTRFADYA